MHYTREESSLSSQANSLIGFCTSWSDISLRRSLVVHEFDGGIELRVPRIDKGHAVRTVLAEIEENSVIAYMGDDLTDEDALLAIKGKGLGILVREALRNTAADIWIRPPDELLDFLARWLEACGVRK